MHGHNFIFQPFPVLFRVAHPDLQFILNIRIIHHAIYINVQICVHFFNPKVCHIPYTGIRTFPVPVFLVKGIQIYIRCDIGVLCGNDHRRQCQPVLLYYFLQMDICIRIFFRKIVLHIVLHIFKKIFSVHHTQLPPSDHVLVHSLFVDRLLCFFLVCHHSLE